MKVTCHRCNGTGKHSFNLTHGEVCYGCWGTGTVERTEAQVKKAAAARIRSEKRAAEKQIERDARVARVLAIIEAIRPRYENDPRLARVGPEHHSGMMLDWFRFDLSRQGIQVRDLLELENYLPEAPENSS